MEMVKRKMKQIADILNGMFGRISLPKSVVFKSEIQDIPEVKVGYVYTYDKVGYYVGPTCKVFMPYRIKQLLKDDKVEVVDGEIIISGSDNRGYCGKHSELAA